MIYEFRDEEQFKDMKFYKHFLITQEYGRSLCEKEGILGFIESDGIPLGIDFDDSYKDFSREDLSNIVNAILARAKVAFKQQYENDLRGELDYKAKFGIERINFRPEPTHFVSNIKPILEAVENADIPKEAKKEFFENNLSSLELSFYTGYIGLNNWIQEEMPNSKILKEIVGNKINEIKEADIKISVNDKNSISYEEKCFNKMLNDYKADEAFFFDKEKKQQVIKADIFFKLNKDEMVNVLKDIQAIEILQTQRDFLNKLSKYRDSKKKTINSKIESLEKQLEKEKAIKVGFDEFEKLIAQKLA